MKNSHIIQMVKEIEVMEVYQVFYVLKNKKKRAKVMDEEMIVTLHYDLLQEMMRFCDLYDVCPFHIKSFFDVSEWILLSFCPPSISFHLIPPHLISSGERKSISSSDYSAKCHPSDGLGNQK